VKSNASGTALANGGRLTIWEARPVSDKILQRRALMKKIDAMFWISAW